MSSDSSMASGTRSGSTSGSIGGRPASPPTGAYMSSRIVNGPTRPPLAGETAIINTSTPGSGDSGRESARACDFRRERISLSLSRRKGLGGGAGLLPRLPRRDVRFAVESTTALSSARRTSRHRGVRRDRLGREWCDGAGGRVRGGCGSAVSGRGGRARVRGIGRAGAVLHIRPGPVGGGSAESCGNAPAFNAVEILPCAERPALHMGADPLNTGILEKPRNRAENSKSTRGGDPLRCATPPHGPGRAPAEPAAAVVTTQHSRTGREELLDGGPAPVR